MGLVGGGTLSRFAPLALAISLARAFYLPARGRRISLHGLNAHSRAPLVNGSELFRIAQPENDFPPGLWDRIRLWPRRTSVARSTGLYPRFRAAIAGFRCAFSVAGAAKRLAGAHSSVLDRKVGRFLLADDAARRN